MASVLGNVNERREASLSQEDDTCDAGLHTAIRLSPQDEVLKQNEETDAQAAIRASLFGRESECSTANKSNSHPTTQCGSEDRPLWQMNTAGLSFNRPECCLQPPFTYTKLTAPGQIRLLCRQPCRSVCGKFGWSMFVTSLDSPLRPQYTTLSYAWGETSSDGSHLTDTIHCNSSLLKVSRTVRCALDRITESIWKWPARQPINQYTYLWIDSICINQADPQERGHQVQEMARIYARCENILIWLGEHSQAARRWNDTSLDLFPNESPSLLANRYSVTSWLERRIQTDADVIMLRSLLESPCRELPGSKDIREGLENAFRGRQILGRVDVGSTKAHDAKEHDAYIELTNRAWFQRKSVIQEIAQTSRKPRRVLIADKFLDFQELADRVDEHSLMDLASPLRAEISDHTLLQNLAQYQHTRCTDPHDHIYALLGLSTDCSWFSIHYNQDVADPYYLVAEHYITRGNMIAELALATAKRSSRGLPSWVPDWRERTNCNRSGMHSDAIAALNLGARKLFEESDCPPEHSGTSVYTVQQELVVSAWILRRCQHDDPHDISCRKCKVPADSVTTDLEDSHFLHAARKGKASVHDRSNILRSQELMSVRKSRSRYKWGQILREQFDATMQPDEALCLLDQSPFAFVVQPVARREKLQYTPYTLEFCFQVDEIGWMTNWIADGLRKEPKDSVHIV